jgi:hypothetical protein
MSQPTPVHGVQLHAEEAPHKPAVVEKKRSSDAPPREPRPHVPAARESYSDPYVLIEAEDTFSSTAEVAAAQLPLGSGEVGRSERARSKEAPREEARLPEPVVRRTGMTDEPSFDEVLTSIHKRKP